MKKILLVCSLFAATVANAQLAPYSMAPDFTGVDTDGNTHHLQQYLDEGKTIILDVSATWCVPCWNFFQTGVLEDVYNDYGPDGTNEMMVINIEGDGATTNADLMGTGTNTVGDWLTGTPQPIIDDAAIADLYEITYFPTIYIICPSGIVWECGQAGPDGNYWTAEGLHDLIGDCPSADTEIDPTILLSNFDVTSACGAGAEGTITPQVFLMNLGNADPLTAATIKTYKNGTLVNTNNWTGNLDTYESAWVTLSDVSVTATDDVTAKVENGDDMVADNNETVVNYLFTAIGVTESSAPLMEGLLDSNFPSNGWVTVDDAGNGNNWFWYEGGQFGVDGSAIFDFYGAPVGESDRFISPKLDLSTLTNAYCNFSYTKANYANGAGADKLDVLVSNNCGDTWTNVWSKTSPALDTEIATNNQYVPTATSIWAFASADLTPWAGQDEILVAFKATSGYGNLMFIDNINIAQTPVSVTEQEETFTSVVYPNPSKGMITINGERNTNIRVFDATGKLVESSFMNNTVQTLNLESFGAGLYNVQLTHNGHTSTHRVMIEK